MATTTRNAALLAQNREPLTASPPAPASLDRQAFDGEVLPADAVQLLLELFQCEPGVFSSRPARSTYPVTSNIDSPETCRCQRCRNPPWEHTRWGKLDLVHVRSQQLHRAQHLLSSS